MLLPWVEFTLCMKDLPDATDMGRVHAVHEGLARC